MKTPHEIIQRPIITEKGVEIKDLQRTLVFQVALGATKPEIKRAVEQVFGVKVSAVRTIVVPGKFRRQGARGGYRSDWKKAYVRLKSGEKMIDYLEPA
jgi:large subunit ribosomal protein L23